MASAELGKRFFFSPPRSFNLFADVIIKFYSATCRMLALANISQRAQWFLAKTRFISASCQKQNNNDVL